MEYGNHGSIVKHIRKVMKTITKETNKCYCIPFPQWIKRYCPNLHLTPQGLVVQPGKNDRLIFDGSFQLHWNSFSINMMQSPEKSPTIIYGTAVL